MTKTIFKNKVTRGAILYTLFILFVYRIGSYIVTPGIDPSQVLNGIDVQDGLSSFFNLFGGGSIGTLSLFALGVSPYISASIIIQLLENELVPAMNDWKHQGIEGQNKRSNATKYLALILAFIQAIVIPLNFNSYTNESISAYLTIALFMTAGSALMMWFADRITEKGIGNGISVVIMAGILARFPSIIISTIDSIQTAIANESGAVELIIASIVFLIILLLVIVLVIYYTLAIRKVGINYVRSGRGTVRKNSYIPVKLNPAGVIPVIFVSPIFILFNLIINWIIEKDPANVFTNDGTVGWLQSLFANMFNLQVDPSTLTTVSTTTGEVLSSFKWEAIVPYIIYFTIIVVFSIFYSYVQMNPENMAENLERQSAYVIGVRPGEDTIVYLTKVITRVSLWGGLILAFIATIPYIFGLVLSFMSISGIQVTVIGTGLIIVVNVLVQTYKSLSNKVEAKKYRRLLGEL